jgi:hypothetical protein
MDLIEMRGPEGASCSCGGESYVPNDDGVIFVHPDAVAQLLSHGFDTVEHIRTAEEEEAGRAASQTETSDEEMHAEAMKRLDAEITRQAPDITAEQHIAVAELAWEAPTNILPDAVAWAIDQNIRKEIAAKADAEKAAADQAEMDAAHAGIAAQQAAEARAAVRAEILLQEPDVTEERADFLLAKVEEAGEGAFPTYAVAVNTVIAENPAAVIVLAPAEESEAKVLAEIKAEVRRQAPDDGDEMVNFLAAEVFKAEQDGFADIPASVAAVLAAHPIGVEEPGDGAPTPPPAPVEVEATQGVEAEQQVP